MIAFTVALGVSLATAMMNVMLGVGDKVNKELKTYYGHAQRCFYFG